MDDDDRVVVVEEEEEEEEELIFEAEDEGMEEDEEEKRTVKAVVVEEENVVEVNNEDLEEGEVSEPEPEVSKNPGRTLRVHLPDLLQGIDGNDDIPMNLDTIEKLDRRAKRFNTTNPMPADEVCKVYDSLGIPVEERERRNTGNFRLEYILMYGVFSLSDEDILEYFEEFSPVEVLDLGEDSCIVKFRNCLTSLKAMMELSKPIGEPKKEERIVKHVLTADDEPERRVVTRDIKTKLDGLVHPDDIPLEEMPEGKWRLGNYHKKSDAILLRFPSSKDFKPAQLRHHLSNDKYKPRNTYIPEIEPPVEAKEKEKELEEKKKNFDKKNPWGDIAEEWIAGTGRQREYPIGVEDLEHPPRRFASGMQDWDAPQDDSQPIRIYAPASRKRKIFDRLDYDGRESPEESKTYFSDGEEESDDEEDEMQWKGKLKKPRMGMVADMEEKKNKLDVKSRLKTGGSVDKRVLKRQVSNTKFVVREEIIEEYLDDEEEDDELLVKEARNLDLRQTLTMKIENKPIRQKIQPTKSFSDRFEGGRSKRDNLELDDGEDLPDIEDMKIEIRQYSSDEDGMDVDDNEDERERMKRIRMKDTAGRGDLRASMRGGDLRDRMRGKRTERKENEVEMRRERREERTDTRRDERRDEVRVKKEKDGEQRKESKNRTEKKERKDEQKLIEERVREIEALKKQERKLLEEKERKLKEMEKKREEDRLKQKKEKERERERERERREREKEKERIERERLKAKEKLREKERSRKSRRKSESSDSDSSDSGDSSSDDSDSESESSSSSSSDESDSSDSESESSSSESETERKRGKHSSSRSSKKPVKKESEKKKSSKTEPSRKGKESKVSSKSSGKGDNADDSKKALELRDKLKNYLKKAKEAKDEKDKK